MRNENTIDRSRSRAAFRLRRLWLLARPFFVTTLIISVTAGIAPVLQRLPHANLSLLFMTGVLIVAARYGLWPSIYASLLSFLIFNFFFTPPFHTFKVHEEADLATLVFFLVMASLSGNLAARMRDAMTKRENATRRTAALQHLTRRVAGAVTAEQVLQYLVDHLAEIFGRAVVASAAHGDASSKIIVSNTVDAQGIPSDPGELDRLATESPAWTSWPVETARDFKGVVSLKRENVRPDERDYAKAVIDQAVVALERILLVTELEQAKLISEREQLRAAMLLSVSHDLRTPLASIIGSASSLIEYERTLRGDDKGILLKSILDESERLDRYIQNLLDMTRLEQGRLELHRDWEDVRDLISAASRRLRLVARGFRLETNIAGDGQLIYVHGDLIEQALVNLLDNAARYSPPAGVIRVTAARDSDNVIIEVCDAGPGIQASDREKVFDPFYRVSERDKKSGTGLGLSVCRGIIRAHGGDVTAHANANGSGARLRVTVPQSQARPKGFGDD